ncbi:tRNA preQ1(34) S-adenosylmethionine ribosyltransferase-isomerase QueA [Candidatus Poribacteria bacterium]|nr:tRNA preQ1(34) S-adenosylmethionine ribosyltransferase-isomerase QueA [Candidatus Poribacteria bacterium]MYG05993.1 tRNA preQ1(34) S-adenosylmethionine ribosyltransferase-isomerase QueA [Candidatus Poribacteria bacterium]MYK24151.1 tRNA preQ1(34) S-adenosylmethionine ribosyltransferase-isomerase QueA [Candidatus Poribacteria bacterium]
MKLTDFDYHLPPDRIAQSPLQQRDASRLLVVDRDTCAFHHIQFSQIGDYLPSKTVLVLNDTQVIPARLIGHKIGTGGKIELLLIREKEPDTWEVLAKPRRSLRIGTQVAFGNSKLIAEVLAKPDDGHCIVRFDYAPNDAFLSILTDVGMIPLPPYIRRPPNAEDKVRYQSVYAASEGAIAAPTAGLHFTQELLAKLKSNGIEIATLTLHVGPGTFQPVKVDNIQTHKMHAEYMHLTEAEANRIRTARDAGAKIVAIGTTVVRSLETAGATGTVCPYSGYSELFIYPGHQFNVVDALVTNFHLPKSTLLMLVSAFAGRDLIQKAYQEALQHNYRFYSYGDAMLIL